MAGGMNVRIRRLGAWTLVAALVACLAAVAAAEELWFEDFEEAGAVGASPAGWEALVDMDATVRLADVSSMGSPSGRMAVALEDESFSLSSQVRRKLGAALERGAVEYLVLISTEKPAEAYIEMRADNIGKVFDCHVSGGGNFKCRSNGSLLTLVEGMEIGVWHTIRLEWDTSSWTYRAAVNGRDVTPEGGLRFDQQGVPSEINFKVGSNPKTGQLAYVDAVRVVRM